MNFKEDRSEKYVFNVERYIVKLLMVGGRRKSI